MHVRPYSSCYFTVQGFCTIYRNCWGTSLLPHITHIILTVVSFAKVAVSRVIISAAVSVQLKTASNGHDASCSCALAFMTARPHAVVIATHVYYDTV